jgi:hypothetical protein
MESSRRRLSVSQADQRCPLECDASPIGSLSAPPNWAVAAPEMTPVALAVPDSIAGVAPAASGNIPAVPGNTFGQAVLGTLSRHGFDARHPKSRPVIVRSPAAG